MIINGYYCVEGWIEPQRVGCGGCGGGEENLTFFKSQLIDSSCTASFILFQATVEKKRPWLQVSI